MPPCPQEHLDYERDIAVVKEALAATGIDPADISRFVPGIVEPSHFDDEAAVPVMLLWLPRISNQMVKETTVRRLRTPAAKKIAADVLLAEFGGAGDAGYK